MYEIVQVNIYTIGRDVMHTEECFNTNRNIIAL